MNLGYTYVALLVVIRVPADLDMVGRVDVGNCG